MLWNDELPVGEDAAVLAYAEALLVAKNNCGLFHIRTVEGDLAAASLVRPAGFVVEESRVREDHGAPGGELVPVPDDADEDDVWRGRIVGNAAFWEKEVRLRVPEDMEWRAGDLVAMTGYHCEIEDGEPVFLKRGPVAHLGNHDEDGVGRFLPWGTVSKEEHDAIIATGLGSMPGEYRMQPGSLVDLMEEESVARVRLEPSEALFLWYKPVDETGDETACACLGASGIAFYRQDSIEDNFYGENVEEGLWVYANAKAWAHQSYEGEWDAGIDGDWRPATVEDLERFGYTAEDIDQEIAGHTEEEYVPGRGLALMAAAEETCAKAKAATPAP